jgi:hypothetical protein
VQDGEVPRQPARAVSAQAGESPGDGPAHEREGRTVRSEADRIGSATVQGRRDEGGVVGEPPVHVGDPLHAEPAADQDGLPARPAGDQMPSESRGLLPDADVVGDPVGQDAADAGEPEVDVAGYVGRDGRPARRVVAEEDHGRLCGQDREPGAGRGQLIYAGSGPLVAPES